MRNLLFSVFAIGVATVAAMMATTAMLNAPRRSAPVAITAADQPPAQSSQLAIEGTGTPPPAGTPTTPTPPSDGAKPAGGAASDEAGANGEEDVDKDPYEGIAEEELPPDLQYSADSSVSFPTNI